MGTIAEENGRPTATPGGGRPTYDEAYRRVAREFLRKFSLDGDEEFASTIARRFREAPAKVCCRAIGGWIDRGLLGLGWTQLDLADRIGVDRSAVAKWTAGGAISLGHLVLVLLVLDGDFSDLPLPAREELAIEGYLAALSYIKAKVQPRSGSDALDRERFWCLYHLLSEPYWERAIREGPGPREKGDEPGTQAGERDARYAAPANPSGRGSQATRGRMGCSLGDLPRTPTGGLAVTMKTKLEMMVGYLAGRQGESAESIRRKLRDPAGEASRWLEEVQSRSRDILDGGLLKSRGLDLHPDLRKGIVVQRPRRRRWLTVLLGASAVTLAFVGLAATWRVQDERLMRLETMLRRREAQWGDRFNHLDAILARRLKEVPGMPTAPKEPIDSRGNPIGPAGKAARPGAGPDRGQARGTRATTRRGGSETATRRPDGRPAKERRGATGAAGRCQGSDKPAGDPVAEYGPPGGAPSPDSPGSDFTGIRAHAGPRAGTCLPGGTYARTRTGARGCSPGQGKVRHPVRVPRASIPARTIAAGGLVIIPTVARTRGGDPRAIPLEPR